MKKSILSVIVALLSASAFAAETNLVPAQVEVKYTAAIEGRTAAILQILDVSDTNKIAKIHDAIIAQYRALRSWHDDNDAKLKAAKSDTNAVAQIQSSLKILHHQFISRLSESLTPAQVDQVKDKMTYGVVEVTYNAYLKMYPGLKDEEKNQIMAWLIEARESAMDGGSSDEKHAVFGKYKGRINNYLSKAGYDAKTGKKKSDQSGLSNTNQPAK